MNQDKQKMAAAEAVIAYLKPHFSKQLVLGVGTGSTTNYFIDMLKPYALDIAGAVASSEATSLHLKSAGIEVLELNSTGGLPFYIDGADECNANLQLIKGGGGALTREKIVAAASREFIVLLDQSKVVTNLGAFPLPVEIIPMARSYVSRELLKLQGDPAYRIGVLTDNGNVIVDVHRLMMDNPEAIEANIESMAGVVCCGLFAKRPADRAFIASSSKMEHWFKKEKCTSVFKETIHTI